MWKLFSLQPTLKLNAVFGVPLLIHSSWFLFWAVFGYLAAVEYLPAAYPDQEPPQRWLQALLANLFLFASVLLHEAAHILVAVRARLSLRRIVLFPFGGVRTRGTGQLSRRAELLLALAGPFASLATALVLLLAAPSATRPLTTWVGLFNLALAILNLLPAAPLDGAAILQAAGDQRQTSAFKLSRFSFRAGDLLGTVLVWLGLPLFVIAGAVEGLLLLLFGCLLQIAGNAYLVKQNPWQNQLLRQTRVAALVSRWKPGKRAQPLPERPMMPAHWPSSPAQAPGDGATLHGGGPPPLDRWTVPAGTPLLKVLDQLDRPEAPTHLFVVDGCQIIGVCSRADLLDYLFAHQDTVRSLSEEQEDGPEARGFLAA
jgi:Zn-dependent protease